MERAFVSRRWFLVALAALAGLGWIGIHRLLDGGPVGSSRPPAMVAHGARADEAGPPPTAESHARVEPFARLSVTAREAFLEVRVVDAAGVPQLLAEVILYALGPPATEELVGSLGYGRAPGEQEAEASAEALELLELVGSLGYGRAPEGGRALGAAKDGIQRGESRRRSAPVQMELRSDFPFTFRLGESRRRSASVQMTDLDGVARFVDFDVPSEATALRLSVSRRVAPDLVIPLALPVPPAVTVTLPAVGRLEVEVFDPGRAELQGEHFVRLSGSGFSDWRQQTVEGMARFGGLAADARYQVVVERHGAPCSQAVPVPGPSVQGGTVRVRVPIAAHPRVLGRIVDEAGRPLRGTLLADSASTDLSPAMAATEVTHIAVADDGRFGHELRTLDQAGELRLRLASDRGAPREARVALPPLGLGAERELGDLLLELLPLAVAGKVVEASGEVVAGARVRVFERSPAGRVRALGDELAAREDGSFELHARVPVRASLTLQARAPGFAPSSASRVAPGRADVVLALEPGRGGLR